jgi:hypothetical protein
MGNVKDGIGLMRTSYEQMKDLHGRYLLAIAHGELTEAMMIREQAGKILVRNWTKILEALRVADSQGVNTDDVFSEEIDAVTCRREA